MTNICQPLARDDFVSRGDYDRAGLSMGIDSVPVVAFDDDEVARQRSEVWRLICIDSPGILEKDGEVPDEVDGIPLRPAILSSDYDPGGSREDRPTPTKTILQTDAEDEITERARPVESSTTAFRIYADEIVSISLAKGVRSMAWDFRAGSVGADPFAPEREVNNDWSKHKRILDLLMIDLGLAQLEGKVWGDWSAEAFERWNVAFTL
jgi:hypothetical protein